MPANNGAQTAEQLLSMPEKSLARPIQDLIVSLQQSERDSNNADQGHPTPWSSLQNFLGPLREFVIIAGPPGAGKSAMAHEIVVNIAKRGTPVLLIDFEHYWKILCLRLLACANGRTIEEMRDTIISSNLPEQQWQQCLVIWSARPITPQEIRFNLLTLGAADGKPILLVIDSLQKLPTVPGALPREKLDIWLRELESVKNEFPVTILATSEVSRGEGGRNYGQPSLSALKESGDAEYTARQVIYISPAEDKKPEDCENWHLTIVKNSFGMTGRVPAIFSQCNFLRWRWEEI